MGRGGRLGRFAATTVTTRVKCFKCPHFEHLHFAELGFLHPLQFPQGIIRPFANGLKPGQVVLLSGPHRATQSRIPLPPRQCTALFKRNS